MSRLPCDFSNLPEVFAPTKETKELARQSNHKELAYWDRNAYDKFPVSAVDKSDNGLDGNTEIEQKVPRRTKRGKLWICISVIALVVFAVALGAGLGLGLGQDSESGDASYAQSTSDADLTQPHQYISTRGAYNGTGIACGAGNRFHLNASFATSRDKRDLLLFFQHYSGEIRWMQRLWPDTWEGGTSEELVAADARNGTPITMTSITLDYTQQYHLFYVDRSNNVRQRYRDNVTSKWYDGPLSEMKFKAMDANRIALRSALYGGTIANVNLTGTKAWAGVRLLVGTSPTTIDQLSWRPGLSEWQWEQTWQDVNGYSSPAYMGWARGTTTYAMFVNTENEVDLWWRDTDQGVANTNTHPINQWTKSQVTIPDVEPKMGLSYQAQLFGRNLDDGSINGWNLVLEAENSTYSPSAALIPQLDGPEAVSTSTINVESIPIAKPEELLVFCQAHGDDILMFTGNISSGWWSGTLWPIPDA